MNGEGDAAVDVTAKYTITPVAGTLTINPAIVTVTAQAASKEHGAEDPTFTATVEGLCGEDTEEIIVYSISRTIAGELVGTYPGAIVPDGKAAQGNYTVEYVPADFEILLKQGEKVPVTKVINLPDGTQELNIGQTAEFTITVTNIFNTEQEMTVTELAGVSIISCNVIGASITENVVTANLAPGQVATITAKCVVDETMIRNGYTNKVTVTLGDINGQAEAVLPVAPAKAELKVTKTNKVPNPDRVYSLGEEIEYTITVENTGNVTLTDLETSDVVTRNVGDKAWKKASIAPGEKVTYTTSYTITEDDLKANAKGNVVYDEVLKEYTLTNTAVAEAVYTWTEKLTTLASDSEPTTVTKTETLHAEGSVTNKVLHRDLEIVKTVLNPQDVYDFGDVIRYEITVTNNGTYTEPAGLTIIDQMYNATGNVTCGQGWNNGVYTLSELKPGESITVNCSYTVPEADAGRVIYNTAAVRSGTAIQATDTTDGEKIMPLYNLAIVYVDANTGYALAETYLAKLKAGTPFYVVSPVIEGYTTQVLAVKSDADGMPAHDLSIAVVYTPIAPEEEPEEEPKEPEVNVVTPTDDGGYDLTPISELDTPLADMDLGDHTCCIMHFLLMLASLITLAFYTDSRKKHQARIHQLRESLKAEGKNDPSEKM